MSIDESNRRRREEAETAPKRWTIVGGYDGARHALFVRQDGPWLDPGGEEVEVMPVAEAQHRRPVLLGAVAGATAGILTGVVLTLLLSLVGLA